MYSRYEKTNSGTKMYAHQKSIDKFHLQQNMDWNNIVLRLKELEFSMAETSSLEMFQVITKNKVSLMRLQELKILVSIEWREKDGPPSR